MGAWLAWTGLAVSALWAARCLDTGCIRMLKVSALLAGVFAVLTPPGTALRVWLADSAVLLTRLLAWAAGPVLAVCLLAWLMGVLGRRPAHAGSPARWLALSVVLALGIVCGLLLEPLPTAAEHAAGRAGAATAEAGWWLASFVPDP